MRPAVPLVDMQIGTADGRNFNFDQNVGAAEFRDLDLANFGPRSGMGFNYGLHGLLHPGRSRKTTDSSTVAGVAFEHIPMRTDSTKSFTVEHAEDAENRKFLKSFLGDPGVLDGE